MALRLNDNMSLTLSRDISSSPQDIIMKHVENVNEDVLLTEAAELDQPLPVATNVFPMGTIATGRFLYIKPAANVSLIFNGGTEQILIRGGKVTRLWADFTSLDIVVTGAPVQVHAVVAGQ